MYIFDFTWLLILLPQNHKIVKIAVGRIMMLPLHLSVIFNILLSIFMHIMHGFI